MEANNNEFKLHILCQCTNCGSVFEFGEKALVKWKASGCCPHCGGSYTIIKHKNTGDDAYLRKFIYHF